MPYLYLVKDYMAHQIRLSDEFLHPYRKAGDPFNSLLARSTYLSKYCRNNESWSDTIRRVVEGNIDLDPAASVQEAEKLYHVMWHGKGSAAGRGLWTGGVPGIPVAAYNNCYAVELRGTHDWHWTALMLMSGGGVGVSLARIDELPTVTRNGTAGADILILCRPDHVDLHEVKPDLPYSEHTRRHVVQDSREGWADALKLTLDDAWRGYTTLIDVSLVRPRGAPLKTFGGLASGPGPLVAMLRAAFEIVRSAAGSKLSSVDCLDITNHIGKCIAAGGARRSALIVVGEANDTEFMRAKHDWEKVKSHRFTSNNSFGIYTREQLENTDWLAIVHHMRDYGEPGVINFVKAWETDDGAVCPNPCQPGFATVLTPDGIRLFDEIEIGSTIWSGKRWTKVTNKVFTGIKLVHAYHTRAGTFIGTGNHRVVSEGEKVEVDLASCIDIALGPPTQEPLDPQDVMDGLVIGDGTMHRASSDLMLLCIGGNDGDYHNSEVAHLIGRRRSGIGPNDWEVTTTIESLPRTFERTVPFTFRYGSPKKMAGFLRGLYSANGSLAGNRVSLKQSSFAIIEAVQEMLSALGIASYYTTNKAHDIEFRNGWYKVKQSYDLQIATLGGRVTFAKTIGFLQKYKTQRLAEIIARIEPTGRSKRTFDIVETTYLGELPVYDITVDDEEHTYWTGGLLVSNCGELILHNREACCLSELFPAKWTERDSPFEILTLMTRYTLRQRLPETEDPESESVRRENMRIGIGLGGVCDFDWQPVRLERWRDHIRDSANSYADFLGVNRPIAVTTVKPSGTLSTMYDTAPGSHARYAPYYIRRTRIAKNEPMAGALAEAGVPHEECVYTGALVFEFPVAAPTAAAYVLTESARSQLVRQVDLQRYWADNAVSTTITFDESEVDDLAAALKAYVPELKSTSCLQRSHSYEQAPYETIDRSDYEKRHAAINHGHPLASGDIEIEECTAGGHCPVR